MKQIELTQGFFAIVDEQDHHSLAQHAWCVKRSGNNWYAVRHKPKSGRRGKLLWMHRIIAGLDGESLLVVHHKNGDSLDNRRENLKVTTQKDNLKKRNWRRR